MFAVLALVGCGSAQQPIPTPPNLFGNGMEQDHPTFHSASQTYSVRQVEEAFADQGVHLRIVTSDVWRPYWWALDGRPTHQIYVFVIRQSCKCLYKLPIHNARKTHHGNVSVAWQPRERSVVRAALRELR